VLYYMGMQLTLGGAIYLIISKAVEGYLAGVAMI
jgi:hypothetical protein